MRNLCNSGTHMLALLLGRVPVASKHANEALVFWMVASSMWSEDDRRFLVKILS